jgi:hypothetical protein
MASIYIKTKKKCDHQYFLKPQTMALTSSLLTIAIRPEAFRCLSEGLKHSYDNWKMWQNYLYVAVVRSTPVNESALSGNSNSLSSLTCTQQDLGEFQASLQAMSRLVDLVGPSVDIEVLRGWVPSCAVASHVLTRVVRCSICSWTDCCSTIDD